MKTTVRQPPSAEGRTHASSVIPVVKSSEFASGTVTQSLTPSKLNAEPNRPAPLHTGPEIEPTFPFPEESAALEPDPASNPYAATRPTPNGGPVELLTVTVIAVEVVVWEALSRATAVSW